MSRARVESETHRTTWIRVRVPGEPDQMRGRCSCGWEGELLPTPRAVAQDCIAHLRSEGIAL